MPICRRFLVFPNKIPICRRFVFFPTNKIPRIGPPEVLGLPVFSPTGRWNLVWQGATAMKRMRFAAMALLSTSLLSGCLAPPPFSIPAARSIRRMAGG